MALEGLHHVTAITADAPRNVDFYAACSADIPPEHALQGFAGVRAHSSRPPASARLLGALGFVPEGGDGDWVLAGEQRHARWGYDQPPPAPGVQGAGSIHHVALSAPGDAELSHLRTVAAAAGARPTPIIDRGHFHSVYVRKPSGVLHELATRDVGFTVDEPLESLGHGLMLPAPRESRRAQLERELTPITNPRPAP